MTILYCAKEAGGGALISGFIDTDGSQRNSIFIGGEAALPYFAGLDMQTYSDQISDDMLENIVLKEKPEKIITVAATGYAIDKKILLLARKHAIKIDSYVDHYWNIWQRFADPLTAKKWAYMPDRIFLIDKSCIDRAIKFGADKENLYLFSHPLLNKIEKKLTISSEVIDCCKKKYNLPLEAVLITFVSETFFSFCNTWKWDQPSKGDLKELFQLLLKASKESDDRKPLIILVRAHPSETFEKWTKICSLFPGARWVNASEIPKQDLFMLSSSAFGLNSMLLLEFVSEGIPVYSYHKNKKKRESWLSTLRQDIIELENVEMMDVVIKEILTN